MKKVLNATAHVLSAQHIDELRERFGDDCIITALDDSAMPLKCIAEMRSSSFQDGDNNTFMDIVAHLLDYDYAVLPCGSPALAWQIAQHCVFANSNRTKFLFAYSERVSEEMTLPDGSVEKKSTFAHKGFQIL